MKIMMGGKMKVAVIPNFENDLQNVWPVVIWRTGVASAELT
jgi:hypothetical protein